APPRGISLAVTAIDLHDALPRNDSNAVRPDGPRLGELGGDVGAARRLGVELGAGGIGVVELPSLRMLPHRLPAAAPDRGVAEVLPVERTRLDRAAPERREHATPLERQRMAPWVHRRVLDARRLEHGWNAIGELERRPNDARLDPAARPMDDQRRRDATLVHPALVEAKRRI